MEEKDLEVLFGDFIATYNDVEDIEEAKSYFPEFKDYDSNILGDFIATYNDTKDVNAALSYFEEFTGSPEKDVFTETIIDNKPDDIENNKELIETKKRQFDKGVFKMAERKAYDKYKDTGEIDISLLPKENDDPNIIQDYLSGPLKFTAGLFKGVGDLQSMGNMLLMDAGLRIFSDVTDKERQALVAAEGKKGQMQNFVWDKVEKSLDKYQKKYENESFLDDWEQGNKGLAVERAIGAAIESIPTTLAAFTGIGGIIALGGSLAGSKFKEEYSKDPKKGIYRLAGNALLSGATEASFELVTRGLGKKIGLIKDAKGIKAAKEFSQSAFQRILNNFGIAPAAEGISEAATRMSTDFIDYLTLGKEWSWEKSLRGALEEGLVGSISGGGFGTVAQFKNSTQEIKEAAALRLMSQSDKADIGVSIKKINEAASKLENANETETILLEEIISEESSNIEDIKRNSYNKLNNLSKKDLNEYAKNSDKIQDEISKIKKGEVTEELALKKANENIKNLTDANTNLINEAERVERERKIKFVEEQGNLVLKASDQTRIDRAIREIESETGLEVDRSQIETNPENFKIEIINENNVDEILDKYSEDKTLFSKKDLLEEVEGTYLANKGVILMSEDAALGVLEHEGVHNYFDIALNKLGNEDAVFGIAKVMMDKMKSIDADAAAFVDRITKRYESDPRYKAKDVAEEVLSFYAQIKKQYNRFDKKDLSSSKLATSIRRLFQNSFNLNNVELTEDNVMRFIDDYLVAIEKGSLTKFQERFAKGEVEISESLKEKGRKIASEKRVEDLNKEVVSEEPIVFSKKDEQTVNNFTKKDGKPMTQIEWLSFTGEMNDKGELVNQIKIANTFEGAIRAKIKGTNKEVKNYFGRDRDEVVEDFKELLSKRGFFDSKVEQFNPEINNNFSGYMAGIINNAYKDLLDQNTKRIKTVPTSKKIGSEDSKVTVAETLVSDEISPEEYADIQLAKEKLEKIEPQQSAIANKIELTENELNLAKREIINFLRKTDRPAMTDPKKFFKALVDYTTGKGVQPGGFANVIYNKLSLPKNGELSTKNRESFIRKIAEDLIALNKVDPSVMRRSKWTPFYELEIKNMNPTQMQKAIDEGRIPSTSNLKSGLDLFKTLDPSVDQITEYLMNIRPDVLKRKMPKFLAEVIIKNEFNDIVDNTTQPVYDTKGNVTDNTIDLSETVTEEEVKRGAPQVREKIARPEGVKFSKTSQDKVKKELDKIKKLKDKERKSGKEELDIIVDAQGLANIRGNVDALRSVMVMVADKAKKFGLDGINKILMPGNLTSGNRIDLLRRFGFNVISNPDKIKNKKLRKEAYQAIEKGEFLNLSLVLKEVTKGVDKIKNENVNAIKVALGAKSGESAKRNASRKKQHDKGVELITNLELDIFLESAEGEAFIRLIGHNDKLNKNGSRNQALPNSVEVGATVNGKRRSETTDEHQWQANEWVKGKLKLFKNIKNNLGTKQEKIARKALDLYLDFSKDNYTQFLLKNETDIIKGDLTNDKGEIWKKSGSTLHPILKEKLNNFIELASKKGTTEEQLKKAFNEIPSADIRYFSDYGYVNPNFIRTYKADGSYTTKAEQYNVDVPDKFKNDPNVIVEQGKIIEAIILTEAGILTGSEAISKAEAKQAINEYLKIAPGQQKAGKFSKSILKDSKVLNVEGNLSMQDILSKAASIDEALSIARDPNAPVKKIRVFDFDDTLATTKSDVLFTAPDGTEGKLNAEEFAKDGARLLEEGYVFDFSEFNKVTDGKPGPLLDIAKKIQEARGTEDVFVLTARAPEAQVAIKEFLEGVGLNIPLENITGLGNSTGAAKANWIVDKAAKGYNDFYFADDAYQNVKAVQDALDQIDVKSKVQQAKIKFSKTVNEDFNKIIEQTTGIASEKVYSRAKAKVRGAGKGNKKFFIPYSAEDFMGLIYPLLSKGKLGDSQMAWFKKNLLDPYARAMENLSRSRINLLQDFKALKKALEIPKNLRKKNESGFTNEQAVRVYLFNKMGYDVPGLSKTDLQELVDVVNSDGLLKAFADQIMNLTKGDGYAKPGQSWLAGTITTDLIDVLNTVKRSKYLEQAGFTQNAELIFSEENLNKLEAAYGEKYRDAMENILKRMKSGKNRLFSGNRLSNRVLDYINGSIGAIMFFNTRSAVLQTISSINFINWSFNNPIKAGKAFANQKQYWKDFKELMNSDYLVDRRNGLKLNINENEIADAAATSKNKAKAAMSYILQKGFLPTQFADSFAIASGGATFYRNRINDLVKNQGMTEADAKKQAMLEFRQIAETSQQSSDPSKISAQQASDLGRVILAFANTPMQYARLQKRAIQDLVNRRGDAKANVSKIIYYGVVQNLIFNALQQALFALGSGDDEDEMSNEEKEKYEKTKQKKYMNIANGMLDSFLRGLGIAGASVSVVKNFLLDVYERSGRKRPEYVDAVYKLLQISPPISSKISKVRQAAYQFDSKKRREEIFDKGFSIDNPAYEAASKVISATTNLPLDRLYNKANNIEAALAEDTEAWQTVAMLAGWPEWQIKQDKKEVKTNYYNNKKYSTKTYSSKKYE